MDILFLVDRLENLVASSKKMPLVNQVMLKEAEILNIIDQMRTAIPNEVKQARRILQEKEHILEQAREEAADLLTQTRMEAEEMLSRQGLVREAEERADQILQQAYQQAQELLQNADEQTEQLQNEADEYAAETLRNLRQHLLNVGTEVERTILSIERGLASLEEPQNQSAEQSPEQVDTALNGAPRNASLAADTMGGPFYNP